MTVSPPLNPILMLLEGNGSLAGRDRAGAFTATGSGALRYAPAPGARVNRVLNARFASDTSRWQTNGGVGATHSRVADARFAGGFACRVFAPGDQPYRGLVQSPSGQVLNAPDSSVTQVTISFDIVVESGPISGLQAGINSYTADNAFLATPASANFSVSALNTLERKSLTANANANLYSGSKIVVYIVNGQLADSQFLISNIVLEWGSVSNATYFEPTVWLDPRTGQLGTAHASPSVSRAVFWVEEATTNLVVNPSVEAATLSGLGIVNSGVTLTKDATAAYLGASSVKAVTDGSVMNQGVYAQTAGGSAGGATTARAFTGSVYARGSVLVEAVLRVYYTDASNSETISAAITLSGGWQRLNVTHTTTAGKTIDFITIRLRQSGAALAATFFADCFQIEEKAYATSYCDGSLGTGYTWAGTAHASASSRATTNITLPSTNRISSVAGFVMSRIQTIDQNQTTSYFGVGSFGILDWLSGQIGFAGNNRLTIASKSGANPTRSVDASPTAFPDNTPRNVGGGWDATTLYAYIAGVGAKSASRVDAPVGNLGVGNLTIGNGSGFFFNGLTGPVAIYDVNLTDARRTLVNAAIDSNGATDLWTLFEELELINLPANPLELPSGVGKAGASLTNINGELLQMGGNEVSVGADLIHVPQSLDVQTSRSSIGTMLDNQHRNLVLEDTSKIFALPYEVTVDWSGV